MEKVSLKFREGERKQRSDVPSSPEVAHCEDKRVRMSKSVLPLRYSSQSYDVLVQIAGHSPHTFGDPGSRTLAKGKEGKTARQGQKR